MVDDIRRYQGRHDYRRDANAVLIKREAVLVVLGSRHRIGRWDGVWRCDMIIKATVLIPRDDQEARLPMGRTTNRLIDRFYERFAGSDPIAGMLRITSRI